MIRIYIATHKQYDFPVDEGYQPIHVGKKNSTSDLGISVIGDNEGDNISELNPSYCELTALYWIWKNSDEDIVGLVHYRRYFAGVHNIIPLHGKGIASSNDFDLNKYDLIVARKRNYYVTNIKNHYCRAHSEGDLNILRSIVEAMYPDYNQAFDTVIHGRKISLYNMFVGKADVVNQYCQWLFPLLDEVNKQIDFSGYDSYQKRILGFMAERLFNVWIEHNKRNIKVGYRKVVNIEGENLIKKGSALLVRHFLK
ncbi:TPA: DUF4422 domain-containing protein [Citrobacter koseri]|nr:DUF4422 domain-containing protein [Citrobacter koseri]